MYRDLSAGWKLAGRVREVVSIEVCLAGSVSKRVVIKKRSEWYLKLHLLGSDRWGDRGDLGGKRCGDRSSSSGRVRCCVLRGDFYSRGSRSGMFFNNR